MWKEMFYANYQEMKVDSSINSQTIVDFINKGILFYEKLLKKIENDTKFYSCVYFIYIHLGDLHRYLSTEQWNESTPRKSRYNVSKSFYSKALLLDPHQGYAYHGLAVIATYEETHCLAIYCYLRAATCKHPLRTANQNIRIELERNEASLKESLHSQPMNSPFAHKKQYVDVNVMNAIDHSYLLFSTSIFIILSVTINQRTNLICP